MNKLCNSVGVVDCLGFLVPKTMGSAREILLMQDATCHETAYPQGTLLLLKDVQN